MNRQIRFRGKRKDTGEWVYGDLLHIDSGCLIYFGSQTETETPYIEKSSPIAVELFKTEIAVVDPESVGQFTGLLDRNGKEIYEGDIVSWLFFHGSLEVGKVEYKREEAQFRIVNTTMDNRESTTTIQNKRNLMVRGNIHDNPELLNDK